MSLKASNYNVKCFEAGKRGIELKQACLVVYGFDLGKSIELSETKALKLMMEEVVEKDQITMRIARRLRDLLFEELGTTNDTGEQLIAMVDGDIEKMIQTFKESKQMIRSTILAKDDPVKMQVIQQQVEVSRVKQLQRQTKLAETRENKRLTRLKMFGKAENGIKMLNLNNKNLTESKEATKDIVQMMDENLQQIAIEMFPKNNGVQLNTEPITNEEYLQIKNEMGFGFSC